MIKKYILLPMLLVCLGVAAAADIQAATEFKPGTVPDCRGIHNLHLDDAGSIFVVCTDAFVGPDRSALDCRIVKFDRQGNRDTRWGSDDIATFAPTTRRTACQVTANPFIARPHATAASG